MKKHSFVDKHPVQASILLTLLAIVLIPLVTEMVSALLNIGMYYWLLSLAVLVIVSLIVLVLYKLWFRPEFSGMIPGNLKEGCILLLPAVPYWLISLGYSYVFEKETLAPHMSGVIIRTALTAGILEELCFRGLMVTTLLRQWRKKDKYLQAAIVSGVVFGLIHATNAIVGADLVRTGMQVLDAGFIGVFFPQYI